MTTNNEAMTKNESNVQRIARPLWFPVSLFVTVFIIGLSVQAVELVVTLPSLESSGWVAAGALIGVLIVQYVVWSIPVRLRWIIPPPEFKRGETDVK